MAGVILASCLFFAHQSRADEIANSDGSKQPIWLGVVWEPSIGVGHGFGLGVRRAFRKSESVNWGVVAMAMPQPPLRVNVRLGGEVGFVRRLRKNFLVQAWAGMSWMQSRVLGPEAQVAQAGNVAWTHGTTYHYAHNALSGSVGYLLSENSRLGNFRVAFEPGISTSYPYVDRLGVQILLPLRLEWGMLR